MTSDWEWTPFPPIGDAWTLNPAEQKLARYLAHERETACREAQMIDPCADMAHSENDLNGAGGELAFCRLHNVYPDTDIIRVGPLPAGDAELPGGLIAEVKTTEYRSGKLLLATRKVNRCKADVFALMTGEFPGPYRFRGFMQRSEFVKESRVRDFGYGPAYCATQDELCYGMTVLGIVRMERLAKSPEAGLLPAILPARPVELSRTSAGPAGPSRLRA